MEKPWFPKPAPVPTTIPSAWISSAETCWIWPSNPWSWALPNMKRTSRKNATFPALPAAASASHRKIRENKPSFKALWLQYAKKNPLYAGKPRHSFALLPRRFPAPFGSCVILLRRQPHGIFVCLPCQLRSLPRRFQRCGRKRQALALMGVWPKSAVIARTAESAFTRSSWRSQGPMPAY